MHILTHWRRLVKNNWGQLKIFWGEDVKNR